MNTEQLPVRQLRFRERFLLRLGRCPTCHKRLASITQDDVESWHNHPSGFRQPVGRGGYGSQGSMTGNITTFRHQKIPHCPGCNHTFAHGWIYPVGDQAPADDV